MKKIVLGLSLFILGLFFFFNVGNETTTEDDEPTIVMIAPDLDLSSVSDEDMAILISQGWDFSGEVPTLIRTEEDLGEEIVVEEVIDLSKFLDDSHQNVSESD